MASKLSQAAVMNVDKGEDIVGGWATPVIPQVGIYKLLAKKKTDGTIEWAHFVQRDSGLRERVMRGTVSNQQELDTVIEVSNRNLRKFFGVTMQAADYDMYTLDGRKSPPTKH